MATNDQLVTIEDSSEMQIEPLNDPYPFTMRPFPYELIGVSALPLEKADVGIPFDSSEGGT